MSNWLAVARDPKAKEQDLAEINNARRRVLSYPIRQAAPGYVLMDYDPMQGIVQKHSDEKMAFFLSSDPDESQTTITVLKFFLPSRALS